MRKPVTAAVLALACVGASAACLAATGSFGSPTDIEAIKRIEMTAASQTEVDKVIAYCAAGAIVADYIAPGWYKGVKEIRANFAPQFAAVKSVKTKMREINVASDGDFACAMMKIHFVATLKDNSVHPMDVRQLDAFRKIGGKWRIVQEQISVPAKPDGTPIFVDDTQPVGPIRWSGVVLDKPVPTAQAREEIHKWLVASEIPATLPEMQSYYGPGDDFIVNDVNSWQQIRGHQANADYYGAVFPNLKNMEIKIPFADIQTDGAFGVEISEEDLTINMKNGSRILMSFRQNDCLRRVGGTWYSFFEMGSYPVDMKTGKSITVKPEEYK